MLVSNWSKRTPLSPPTLDLSSRRLHGRNTFRKSFTSGREAPGVRCIKLDTLLRERWACSSCTVAQQDAIVALAEAIHVCSANTLIGVYSGKEAQVSLRA